MIVTVTMNPAIDKTVEINALLPGGLNRIARAAYDAGGKGINVSKTLRELGCESIATGFLGGNAGRTIEAVLKERGIRGDFVRIKGETRTNTKILENSGAVTELNEPGPAVRAAALDELIRRLETYAGEETLFVLAGSLPSGVDEQIYADIIQRVHKKGASVLLDADGAPFRRALDAKPDIIKPNRAELTEYAALPSDAPEEALLKAAIALRGTGIDTVVVSMGKSGAMMIREGCAVKCPALSVRAHSTVGAGDAMVAALAYAWERRLDNEQTMQLCMAVSAGAVTTVGTKPPTRALVDALAAQVVMKEMG